LVKGVSSRSTEARLRPALISSLQSLLIESTLFTTSAHANTTLALAALPPAAPHYTLSEISYLSNLTSEASKWFENSVAEQEKTKVYEDPVLKVTEMEKRMKSVGSELERLKKKKAPRVRVPLKSKKVVKKVVEGEEDIVKEPITEEKELKVEEGETVTEEKEKVVEGSAKPDVEEEVPIVEERKKDEL
jgi:hypoxia up-regulated 1